MSIILVKGRQLFLPAVACFVLACTPLVNAQGASSAPNPAGSGTPSQAIIFPFTAVTSPASVPPTVPDASCPDTTARPASGAQNPVDPRWTETIDAELTKKLSKKMQVTIAPVDTTITPGTLVFAGCLTTINAGNAAERMVGLGLGSSQLSAHVRVLLQTKAGLIPQQDFEVSVKAGNKLPPIGPAGLLVHGAKETRQTLTADAKKLADQIAKKFAENNKNRS
jgi:hypothetical protein